MGLQLIINKSSKDTEEHLFQQIVMSELKQQQDTGYAVLTSDIMLSEYAQRRLANIKRNNARLAELKLTSVFSSIKKGKAVVATKRKRKTSVKVCRRHLSRKVRTNRQDVSHSVYAGGSKLPHTQKSNKAVRKAVEKLDRISGAVLGWYNSGYSAAKDIGGHQSAISSACNNRIKTHRGYSWQFASMSGSKTPEPLYGYSHKKIYVGKTRVFKQFMDKEGGYFKWFHGVVAFKCGVYYRIIYNDGDTEDMTHNEVIKTMT